MKAKVLATGEIINVKEWRGASECVYSTPDMNMFYAYNDLEFLPDTREIVVCKCGLLNQIQTDIEYLTEEE